MREAEVVHVCIVSYLNKVRRVRVKPIEELFFNFFEVENLLLCLIEILRTPCSRSVTTKLRHSNPHQQSKHE